MSIKSLSMILGVALAACAAQPHARSTPPATMAPPAWARLTGPHATLAAACADCQLSPVHALPATGPIVAVAQATRGLESFLALQTARGWYLEERKPTVPMESHHEPRSRSYELERTRIADGVVVRMVDRHRVFYPGQGNRGSSHTSWSERTCRVYGDGVACSGPTSIATQSCTHGNDETGTRCTGNEPSS